MKALNRHYTTGGGFPIQTIVGIKYESALLNKNVAETFVYVVLYIEIKSKKRYFLSNLYHKLREKHDKDYNIKRTKRLNQTIRQCKEKGYLNEHYQLTSKGQDLLNWYLFCLECLKKSGLLPTFQHILTAIVFFLFGLFVKKIFDLISKYL